MALPQIGTVTVPALVIAFNNLTFVEQTETDTVIGKILNVPCRDILYDNLDRWAIPQKNFGVFSGFNFEYKVKVNAYVDYTAQPTYDSFTVFRIRDTKSLNEWIIYGTQEDLITSCATCCDGDPVPMPGISPSFLLSIAPCQLVDIVNGGGTPYGVFGLPTLGAGQNYFPYGGHNNVGYPSANANGYSTVAALLVFLNANFTPYVWTVTADNLTLIATGGSLDDLLCINVVAVTPS